MEQIKDILREMRKDMPRVVDTKVILRNYADRIEAAHERETVTNRNTLNTKSPENVNSERVVYNGAKIREALEIISRTKLPPNSHTTEEGEVITYADGNKWLGRMRTVVALTKDALAEPPRNCDRFNNADELVAHYGDDALKEAWRELREKIKNGKYEFAIDLVFMIDWLFAEAKGEKENA